MFGSEGTNQQIQVYAGNKINVERTLRSLNYLVIMASRLLKIHKIIKQPIYRQVRYFKS